MPYDAEDELRKYTQDFDADPGAGVQAPEDDSASQDEADDTSTPDVQADALPNVATEDVVDKAPQQPSGLDALRQQLYQGILQRRGGNRDEGELKRLQLFSLLGQGLGQISSGIARNAAANYFGGTADPNAVALTRSRLMENASQAGEPIAALANAPVQQYIQRRQQELAGDKLASEDARTLAQVERAAAQQARATGQTFSPEDIAKAQQTAKAMGVPEDALPGVTPKNVDKIIAEQGRGSRSKASIEQRDRALAQRLEELDLKLKDHRLSAGERQRIQAERLEVQRARLGLQAAVQSNRATADVSTRQVPEAEFENALTPQEAALQRTKRGFKTEAVRGLNELADTLDNISVRGQLDPTSPEYGKLTALYQSLGPKAVAGEFGNSFTIGHDKVIHEMIRNPQGFKGFAQTAAVAAAARKAADELERGYRSSVEGRGGKVLPAGTPGRTKGLSAAPVQAAAQNAQRVAGTAPSAYAVSPDGKQRIPLDAKGQPIGPAEPMP